MTKARHLRFSFNEEWLTPLVQAFNKYVYVLLDGHSHRVRLNLTDTSIKLIVVCLQFPDERVKQGFGGGRRTAEDLRTVVKQYLRNQNVSIPWDTEIFIYVWCDAKEMARQYVAASVIPSREGFLHFRTGFNYSADLTVNWHIPTDQRRGIASKQKASEASIRMQFDSLILSVSDNFLKALQDPDCWRIVFALSTFRPFAHLLESETKVNPSLANLVEKIDPLLQSEIFEPQSKILASRSATENAKHLKAEANIQPPFAGSSSGGTTLQGTPEEEGKIIRNKEGKRIDPHLKIPDNVVVHVKGRRPKLCNNFHLRGTCTYGNTCGYTHGYLSGVDKIILQEIAREQPCRNGPTCSDPACYAGHRCLRRQKCGNACRFPKDMHFKDTKVVNGAGDCLWSTSTQNSELIELLRKES